MGISGVFLCFISHFIKELNSARFQKHWFCFTFLHFQLILKNMFFFPHPIIHCRCAEVGHQKQCTNLLKPSNLVPTMAHQSKSWTIPGLEVILPVSSNPVIQQWNWIPSRYWVWICGVLVFYQQVASLGQRDELLVPRGAHVEADRQHLLQRRHDQRRLDGVELPSPLLVPPLLILASRLEQKREWFSRFADTRQDFKQFET